MNTVRHIAEMVAEEPGLVLSGLAGRILAIEYGSERTQIGQASHFHLKTVKVDEGVSVRLACKIEVDQEKFDQIKDQVSSGEIKLVVENIALGAISRPSS